MIIKHKEGCTPVQPCSSCEAARFLHTKLSREDYQRFVGILEGTGASLFENSADDTFEFSVRTANLLKNAEIKTVRQLLGLTSVEFLRLPNAGRKQLNEVKELLSEKGLKLGQLA